MTDRQPTPGREGHVTITLDTGEVLRGTLEMDDLPLEDGTPWAKETVLPDAVAQKYGLTSTAVPANIFDILSAAVLSGDSILTNIAGIPVGVRIVTGSYVGTGTYGEDSPTEIDTGIDFKFGIIANGNTGLVPSIYGAWSSSMVYTYGQTFSSIGDSKCTVAKDGEIFRLYLNYGQGQHPEDQLNELGETYRYLFIG